MQLNKESKTNEQTTKWQLMFHRRQKGSQNQVGSQYKAAPNDPPSRIPSLPPRLECTQASQVLVPKQTLQSKLLPYGNCLHCLLSPLP